MSRGMPFRPGRDARAGFILVAVLGVMALMAGLVGSTALLVRAAFDGARANADDLALDGLVRAGLDLAGHQLYGLKIPAPLIEGQEIRLDSGTVRLSISDESGRIDLNGADPGLLAAACEAAGCRSLTPAAFAAKAIAWRDRNDRPLAEQRSAGPGTPQAARRKDGFGSVEELSRLPGLSAADLAALRPLVTVANPSGKINPMSAAPVILTALPDMTTGLVAQILALRGEPGPKTAERIARLLPRQQSLVTVQGGPSYRVRIEARRGAGAMRTAEAVITRAPGKLAPFFILAWSS